MMMNVESVPYDSRVNYLESSGTQYIQLPSFTVTSDSFFAVGGHLIAVYNNTTNKYRIFGSTPDAQFRSLFYSYTSSTNRVSYSTTIGSVAGSGNAITFTVGNKSSFEVSTLGKTVNGNFTSLPRSLTGNITGFRLFGGYSTTTRYPIKICDFYIKAGDSKIFDLIAVRVGQVGYMYDKISKQLFGNVGSGSFTLGNDI